MMYLFSIFFIFTAFSALDISKRGSIKDFKKHKKILFQGKRIYYQFNKNKSRFTVRGRDRSCLKIDFSKEPPTMHLAGIEIEDNDCPFTGTDAIAITDAIAEFIQAKFVTVVDVSEVICKINNRPMELARYKLFSKGKTWYESHGFHMLDYLKYRMNVAELHNYPLSKIMEHHQILASISKIDYQQKFLKLTPNEKKMNIEYIKSKKRLEKISVLEREYAEYMALSLRDATLRSFIQYVQRKGCATYMDVSDLLLGYEANHETIPTPHYLSLFNKIHQQYITGKKMCVLKYYESRGI